MSDMVEASQGVSIVTAYPLWAGVLGLQDLWRSTCAVLTGPFTEVQAILFVDDKTVSKGMVKYASNLPRESIVDVSGEVHVPDAPVAGCTCSKVRLSPLGAIAPHCATLLIFLPSS